MSTLAIFTYDWVPKPPRGYVRDLRLRWACEEAGLDYRVVSVPFKDRGPEHLARQPFAQVPFIEDDGVTIFESGACLLHLAKKSEILLPRDPQGEAETIQWLFAAFNSIEVVTVPWWYLKISGGTPQSFEGWMAGRFAQLDAVLPKRDWINGRSFSVADLILADVLRAALDSEAPCAHERVRDYVARITDRPAFLKARRDQIDHFAKGDDLRENRTP